MWNMISTSAGEISSTLPWISINIMSSTSSRINKWIKKNKSTNSLTCEHYDWKSRYTWFITRMRISYLEKHAWSLEKYIIFLYLWQKNISFGSILIQVHIVSESGKNLFLLFIRNLYSYKMFSHIKLVSK